ncbi:MAG: galactose oxidase-like domain-containing protein [Cyanobacteria bacterium P01_D01_bin.44]
MTVSRRDFLILGTGLGIGGFGLGTAAKADTIAELLANDGANLVAQLPPTTVFSGRHSGFMVQSDYGDFSNNFEAVFPSQAEGLTQVYRDNAQGQFPWVGPLPPEYVFACGQGEKSLHGSFFGGGESSEVSLIQSNFKDFGSKHGHLELVVRHGDRLALYWRASAAPLFWTGPLYIPSNQPHTGNPALVQGDFGTIGNFEVVVPHAQSGLLHYVRLNDVAEVPWPSPKRFGKNLGRVDAVAMLQSDYVEPGESNGHLEVIARVSNQLFSLWRASKPPYKWHVIPEAITAGLGVNLEVDGVPGFIQSQDRDFHLVVPLKQGGMAHLRRQNNLDGSWTLENQFEEIIGNVAAVSLLQNIAGGNNLELLVRVTEPQNRFQHFFTGLGDLAWQASGEFAEIEEDVANQGQWQVPYSLDFGTVGIHAAVMHTGKVLLVGYEDFEYFNETETSSVSILDPKTRKQVNALPKPQRNKFCCGHAFLPDGRLVLASGNVTETSAKSLHTFTPSGDGGSWSDFGSMSGGVRWYPTCTTLPDGRVFILAGTAQVFTTIKQTTCSQDFVSGTGIPRQVNKTYEIFDGQTKGPAIEIPELFEDCQESLGLYGLYPFVFVLPDGRLLIHGNTRTYFLDIATDTVEALPTNTQIKTSRTYPSEGSAVLLPLRPERNYQASVMIIGGGVSCEFVPSNNTNCGQGQPIAPDGNPIQTSCPGDIRDDWPATNQCEILTMNALDQGWKFAAPMAKPRVMPDAVLLPDGTVFVCGGSSTGTADAARTPVLEAEIYNPETNQWSLVASMHVPRLYHAAAVLLPSGEVLTSGTDRFYNIPPFNHPEHRVEVFKPPYLFKGPRPAIASVTNQVKYGDVFSVFTPDAASIQSACLIAPGASTHSFNMQQRFVGLKQTDGQESNELRLEAPPNSNLAPPGYYMLFLVNQAGVPSEAKFVQLQA